MSEYTLQFVIDAKNKAKETIDQVKGQMKDLEEQLDKMQPAFKSMAAVGTAGFATVTGVVYKSIDAFKESQRQMAIVDSIIRTLDKEALDSLGGSFELARAEIVKFGSDVQAIGGISDEVASIGLTKLVQITKDYETASEAALIAADLSIYKQIDYASAVDIVGKVLSGNIGILGRYGIQLEEGATKEEALAKLAERTAGQYAAYGKTLEGQTTILKQRMGDLGETIGAIFVPKLTELLDKISPVIEKVIVWIEKNPELTTKILIATAAISGIVAVLGVFGMMLPGIITTIGAFGAMFVFLTGPMGVVIALIGVLIAAGFELWRNWDIVRERFIELWEKIKDTFKSAVDWLKNKVIDPLIKLVDGIISKIQRAISLMKEIGGAVSGTVGRLMGGGQFGIPSVPRTGMYLLHRGETVSPATATGGITVNINGGYYLSETVAEEIGDMIISKLKRTMKI